MGGTKKATAWKKNREFGDIMGGRQRLKLEDNIFAREHSFTPPSDMDEIPLLYKDNASRDYYFPVSPSEIRNSLASIPHSEIVTHVWLRKYNRKRDNIIEAIRGSGVSLITIYPLLKDNRRFLGKKKPTDKDIKWYAPYAHVIQSRDGWYAVFSEDSAKAFYLNKLLPWGVEELLKE